MFDEVYVTFTEGSLGVITVCATVKSSGQKNLNFPLSQSRDMRYFGIIIRSYKLQEKEKSLVRE